MTQLEKVRALVAQTAPEAVTLAKQIWEFAELPYQETKSAAVLIEALEKEGFAIETGLAGIPTAFTATFVSGSGKPVMALLGEYDALDGLSQKAGQIEKEPVVPGGPGHGCGHNLLGAGCYASAVALKRYLEEEKLDGTVIYFGCPAEEGAGSKQFIARAGYFDNVDFCYSWHPATINEVSAKGSVAIMGANFTFDGIAAHAGGCPHLGRSALDAIEASEEEMAGVNIIRRAVEEPLRQIAANAGFEGSVIVEKVREGKDGFGFNAASGDFEDLLAAGIIDPKQVSRFALQHASSVASLLLTTECAIAELPKPEPAMPAGGAGMGGMGGMY